MTPRWARYTRSARGRGRAPAQAVPDPAILLHYGDDYDEEFRDDGRLKLAPVREYQPKVPQTLDLTVDAVDRAPRNPVNQLGPCFSEEVPIVTSSDYGSFLAAFDKRSNAQPPVDDDIAPDVVKQLVDLIAETQGDFDQFDEGLELREQWMAKFGTEKRKRMEKAMLELANIGEDDPYLAGKELSVKIEVLLKRNDPTWAPRLIYSGTDEFNALTGPLVNEVCARLNVLLLNGLGPIKFMMGYKRNDVEIATFLNDDEFPHVAEGDFSKNDLYQRRSVALIYDALLKRVGAPTWLRELFIRHIKFTVSSAKYGLKAHLENQLPTGTTSTTSRNTIWNAVMFAWHCKRAKLSGIASVLGDDLLARLNNTINLQAWTEDVKTCKMVLTASAPDFAGGATFLSRAFCVHGEVACMVPKLFKALARFNARANENQGVSDSAYMAGKALSYAYEFRHFTDLRDLFLQRYNSEEDQAAVIPEEVSWFTRQSGVDLNQLHANILAEPVQYGWYELCEFFFDRYGIDCDPTDILETCRIVITSSEPVLIVAPRGADIDW